MILSANEIEAASLGDVVVARCRGESLSESQIEKANAADVLALAAAADVVRRADCGDEVRVFRLAPGDAVIVDAGGRAGTALLRHVALTRLLAPAKSRVVVDVGRFGPLAQIALSFGASDLLWAQPKSLPTHDAPDPRATLEGEIRRTKRTPLFVDRADP